MDRMQTALCILAMLATPLAYAHDPAGTPKPSCESRAEWSVHDYGAPATGVLVQGYEDGNLADCNGQTSLGSPCAGFHDPDDPLTLYAGVCDLDPPALEWDGHAEHARGGAWILVYSGDDRTHGTLLCYGAEGHHATHGPFEVQDVLLGGGALFTVGADSADATGSGCGDFLADEASDCTGACTVTFLPGIDGAYVVYVRGTQGHVITPPGGGASCGSDSDSYDLGGVFGLGGPSAATGYSKTFQVKAGCQKAFVQNDGPGKVRVTSSTGDWVDLEPGQTDFVHVAQGGTFTVENLALFERAHGVVWQY